MTQVSTPSGVARVPAAAAEAALEHFSARLSHETDCADVFAAQQSGAADFVLLDVRSPRAFAWKHVPGAVNIPYADLTPERLSRYPAETLFVVYCNGPHCNAANKGAVRLARLGRPVKEMIGGIWGWEQEGFEFQR